MAKVSKRLKTDSITSNGNGNGASSHTPRSQSPGAALPKFNRVSLKLVKPDAKKVCVAGSFNEWKPESTPLSLAGNGHWVGDVAIKPGRHEYLFVVDGEWTPDPNATESVANPFGGMNSVMIVST